MDNKKRKLHSLRTRYLLLIATLGVTVLIGILWGQQTLTQTSGDNAARLQTRDHILEHSRSLQHHVFESYKALNAFLLDPTRKEHKDQTYTHLDRAIEDSEHLRTTPWIIAERQQGNVAELKAVLKQLRTDIDAVITTRLEPTRQYPSLATANQQMNPNRDRFNNAVALALRETLQLSEDGGSRDALQRLTEVRHLWSQTVSNFRNYLSNRVGSFDEQALPAQENAIDTMYQLLRERLEGLSQLDDSDALGFETSAALQEMIEASDGWYQGFLRVKAIHQTEQWRADVPVIKERVEPGLTRITTLLSLIEHAISSAAADDLASLDQAISLQTRLSAVAGVLGLAFVIMIVMSLDYLVFRPIKLVAEGLKAEAFGIEGLPLPRTPSSETQDLIDAFSEMRNQVHQRETDLRYQALHDSLTGLPNRSLLQGRMEQAIHRARRDSKPFSFMMMDLDRFKDVNDTLGHQVGDELLREIGWRLTGALREVDTIARLGGDEFAILLVDTDEDLAPQLAEKVLESLAAPFEIDEMHLYVGASIGIAIYPTHGTDVSTLIQRADVAMYVAKRRQLGHTLYEPSQDEYSIGRLTLMADLRRALEEDALDVHYQPKLDIRSSRVVGVEALLRWEHPEYGAIPPEQVVALAEHTGLIGLLSNWVLEKALTAAGHWHLKGMRLNVAVNLSVHNLRDPGFAQRVTTSLEAHGLPASSLTLEITEHAMMANPTEATQILNALDDMGVMIAVDDYGTGFSSLAYLKQLPVDELKIDKSFVMRMDRNSNDEVIVRSTIDLAHNLGLKVVAEGVENAEIWKRLSRFGCDTAQGYHMSRPLPLMNLEQWLEDQPVRS